jgi:hypothetical protein
MSQLRRFISTSFVEGRAIYFALPFLRLGLDCHE